MVVKTSVSISEQQDVFARKLVEDGRFSSVSAVIQHGLELLRERTEEKEAELAALRALVSRRMEGDFVTMEENRRRTEDVIAARKAFHGL
ncbi:ribbon-helix-helix domain-containing protein [Rhizobium sp.]